ncbi:MAG: peptide deformylase [Clostridia bacterium]
MAIRNIREDKDEILYKVSKQVSEIDDKTKILIEDMKETMYKYDGIGLAAVQVGVLKQIIVYDFKYIEEDGVKNPQVLFNPRIIKHSKKMITTEEGCLSFPDFYGKVDRFESITVEAEDISMNTYTFKAKELGAVVLQHEIDHLNGKVFKSIAYDTYYGEKD